MRKLNPEPRIAVPAVAPGDRLSTAPRDEFARVREAVLERRRMQAEIVELGRPDAGDGMLAYEMGPSHLVKEVARQVAQVAQTDFSVLILGETGTGKELVAQAVRRQSRREGRVLVAVDCGAIPEALMESELFGHEKGAFTGADRRRTGCLQLADGGTLFLDELGNLPAVMQAKLLRVMESREVTPLGGGSARSVDVRFIAAANSDLQACARSGTFREDLYFRLAQYTIQLPALRDRPEDIPHLAGRFLREAAMELQKPVISFTPSALALLHQYAWPGNVRELRNIVRQAVLATTADEVDQCMVRTLLAATATGSKPMKSRGLSCTPVGGSLKEVGEIAAREAESDAIRAALQASRGNKSVAARHLRTDYKTLHLKMRRYGICAHDFRAGVSE